MDEASPHLHLDYIPFAHGYKRGLSVRNSLDKAMKEMGYIPENESRKENATKMWKDHERAVFGDICAVHGLEVEEERASKRKDLSVEEYKEARDKMLEPIKQEMQPYQQLEIATNEVDVKGLRLAGWVGVKDKDLKELKEQAKAYIVNRERIKNLNEDEMKLTQWAEDNQRATEQLRDRAQMLAEQEQRVRDMYNRQRNVNVLLEQAESNVKSKDTIIARLTAENHRLKEQVNNLIEKIKGAYQSLTNVVKAIGMLKYDKSDGYKVEGLTKKQGQLIDGIAEYGAYWARKDDFPEMAADMEKNVGISKSIETIIEPQAPQRKRSRGYEMEL